MTSIKERIYSSKAGFETVDTINMRISSANTRIILDPPYQRNVVWDTNKQSEFIHSLYYNIVPNNLIFNVDASNTRTCLDGKQRITSIVSFMDNKIPFNKKNDTVDIYFTKIPKSLGIDNCRIMTDKEKQLLLNTQIPIVSYDGLLYDEQIDIFSRLQNGAALTNGELLGAMLPTNITSKQFDKFCESKKIYFRKYNTNKNKERKEFYPIIVNIMYMVNEGTLKLPTKIQKSNYLTKIDSVKILNMHTKNIDNLINVCFGDDIINHESIPKKISIRLSYAICMSINKTHPNENCFRLDDNDTNIIRSTIRKLHRGITGISKDGTKIKREIFKSLELLINKFDAVRKDIKKDLSPISDDEYSEDDDEDNDNEIDDEDDINC